MTREKFLKDVDKSSGSNDTVQTVEKMYNVSLPDLVKKIISYSDSTVFFGEERRLLSKKEIINASKDLHVDFVKKGIIPLIDALDNDFICYDLNTKQWCFYNIIDDTSFSETPDISKIL